MKIVGLLVIAVFLISLPFTATSAPAADPSEVVRDYINAFKDRNKERILVHLDDVFFEEYKVQYIAKIETYTRDKRKRLLEIFGVNAVDDLKAMSGKSILSTFLDKPESKSYWSSFDSLELVIEVKTMEMETESSVVKSFMWAKKNASAQIETTYTLIKRGADWKIVRFTKKPIRPNQALEPTTPAVTIPAAQEVAPAGVVAHL